MLLKAKNTLPSARVYAADVLNRVRTREIAERGRQIVDEHRNRSTSVMFFAQTDAPSRCYYLTAVAPLRQGQRR